jgi:hypothetical protein
MRREREKKLMEYTCVRSNIKKSPSWERQQNTEEVLEVMHSEKIWHERY